MAGYPITPATDILEWMAKYLPRIRRRRGSSRGRALRDQHDDRRGIHRRARDDGDLRPRPLADDRRDRPCRRRSRFRSSSSSAHARDRRPVCRRRPSRAISTTSSSAATARFRKSCIAPGTVEESFYFAVARFNLAEKYQMPVFLLSEQALCQSKATLPLLEFGAGRGRSRQADRHNGNGNGNGTVVFGEYKRFAFTDDRVSPRVIPGVEGGMHLAAGLRAQRRRRHHRERQEPQAR